MRLWLAALALAGCKKGTPADPVVDFTDFTPVDDAPVTAPGTRPVGPGDWTGGGLSLFVPPGWTGFEGEAPLLLHIQNEQTGVALDLLSFGDPIGRPRAIGEQDCGFVDEQKFRSVPALGLSQTATCTAEDGVRQVWWALVDGRELHVEVFYPPGRMIRGRQAVSPMLEALEADGAHIQADGD